MQRERPTAGVQPETHTIVDHEELRRTAEAHGGVPATVRGTETDEAAGVLRLDFPGTPTADVVEHITWDEWFDTFDREQLALRTERRAGGDAAFYLVDRD